MTLRSVGDFVPQSDLRIVELLEEGVGCATYQVVSERIGRTFLAKFVHRRVAPSSWQKEIMALGRLSHPHIVKLFRVIEDDEVVIVVLDWVDGQTVQQLVAQRGALPYDHLVQLATQLCSALYSVHAIGVIHRNLEPANIRIACTGTSSTRRTSLR